MGGEKTNYIMIQYERSERCELNSIRRRHHTTYDDGSVDPTSVLSYPHERHYQ